MNNHFLNPVSLNRFKNLPIYSASNTAYIYTKNTNNNKNIGSINIPICIDDSDNDDDMKTNKHMYIENIIENMQYITKDDLKSPNLIDLLRYLFRKITNNWDEKCCI